MKIKTLTLAAFGFLSTVIIYSCNNPPKTESQSPTEIDSSPYNQTICSNYTDISTLEVRLIHAMTNKYIENQLLAINQSSIAQNFSEPQPPEEPYGDARTIWFDLETLKAFVYQIENNAKGAKPPVSSKDLGIRIYYASYPDLKQWEDFDDLQWGDRSYVLPGNYQGRHTLIMIPTIFRNGHNADFNPLDSITFTQPLSSQRQYGSNSSTEILSLGFNNSTSNTREAQNHGALYPPPPGGDGIEF